MNLGTQLKNENLEFEEFWGYENCTLYIQLFDAHLGKLSPRPVRVVSEKLGSNFRKIFGKFSLTIGTSHRNCSRIKKFVVAGTHLQYVLYPNLQKKFVVIGKYFSGKLANVCQVGSFF